MESAYFIRIYLLENDVMGTDDRYKKLQINFDYVNGWIESFCSQKGYTIKDIIKSGNDKTINYDVLLTTGNFKISFFASSGNRFTIKHNYGSDMNDSIEFADFLVERLESVNIPTDNSKGFKVSISEPDYNAFIQLLVDDNVDVIAHSKNLQEEQYKIKSIQYGDEIRIHYYFNTHNVFIQGKRLQLFDTATDILSGKCEFVDIVNAEIRYDKICTTSEQVMENMKQSLGNVYSFLSRTHLAIMSNSFKFYRIEMELDDYSVLVQPMCRAMEGYIYKLFELFEDKGIDIDQANGLGYFFYPDTHNFMPLKLREEFSSKIDNINIENAFNKIYNWYYNNRHDYSHSGPYDDTTAIIENRKVADIKFNESVNLFKNTYDRIMEEIRKE